MSAPRYQTARKTHRTYGWRVGRLAAALGKPLLPWQQLAADLIDEHDETGLRTNKLVVMTLPRRSGKTELLLLRQTDKALFGPPNQRLWMTAQTGSMARERWREYTDWLKTTPLGPRLKVKAVVGAERIIFPNGSTIRPFSPTRESLHGMASDEVALDEMWAIDPVRGQEIMAAVGPTMATRPGSQIILTSTMGTAESTWFHGFCDRGRKGDPGVTYLQWSAEGVAPDDYDAIAAAHPSVGTLIDPAFIREQAALMSDTPGEFLRAFCNIPTKTAERVIPRELWDKAVTADGPTGQICLAADISADRSQADIVACGSGVLEVIESRKGHAWVAARMQDLISRHSPAAVCVDTIGPSAALHDELSRKGVTLLPVTGREMATACEAFLTDLSTGALRHRRHPQLDAAVDNAATRPLGDGFAWSRRRASAPISALVAATLASYADQHRPAEPVRPYAAAG